MTKINVCFDLFVECPHCEHTFDLITHDDNDEGFWTEKFSDFINNKPDADKLKEDIECPECDKRIDITSMEY
jgi:DNA-directed RNA polymerase subunit RPC12/RpoP